METQIQTLAKEFNQSETHVQNVVNLIDEGYTIPFIARYRKEMHGAMDDTTLRDLADPLSYLRNLAERREEIKKGLEPLATLLFAQGRDLPAPEMLAKSYLNAEKGVGTGEEALAGASDIIA